MLEAGVVDSVTAERMESWYLQRNSRKTPPLITLFALIGALLTGIGLILVVAHNWDELSRGWRTFFAFLPLLLSQALYLYRLRKGSEGQAWKEISGIFLFFSVGTCLSIISQEFFLGGQLDMFLLTWTALCYPLIFLIRSAGTTALVLAMTVATAASAGFFYDHWSVYGICVAMLAGMMRIYHDFIADHKHRYFAVILHYLFPVALSVMISAPVFMIDEAAAFVLPAWFAILYLVGRSRWMQQWTVAENGYLVLGALSSVSMMLPFSFLESWSFHPGNEDFRYTLFWLLGFSFLSLVLMRQVRNREDNTFAPDLSLLAVPVLTAAWLISGNSALISAILINLYLLGLSVLMILRGIRTYRLLMLNAGLLLFISVAMMRFFDFQISYLWRGIGFIAAGGLFFMANRYLIRRKEEQKG